MSGAEAFTPDHALMAIDQFLEFGEQVAGSAHQGYFSGGGWPARCLRAHRASLAAKAAPTDSGALAARVDNILELARVRWPDVVTLEQAWDRMAADRNDLELKVAAQQEAEPVYQFQSGDGSWIDQTKTSYDYNVKHGAATVRVLYTHAPATPQAASAKPLFSAALGLPIHNLRTMANGLRAVEVVNKRFVAARLDEIADHLRDLEPPVQPPESEADVEAAVRAAIEKFGAERFARALTYASEIGAQAVQTQVDQPRCAAVQHSDQMVCDRCKAAWDVNDPEPPECLPASADAELAQAFGESEKDCATCAHQALPAHTPKCRQCTRLATGARLNWQPQQGGQ